MTRWAPKMNCLAFVFTFSLLFAASSCEQLDKVVDYQPQQIHLAYGENVYEMVATWSTMDATNESIVLYSYGNGPEKAISGASSLFVDGGPQRHQQAIHKVKLVNLEPDTIYEYRCGSKYGWSATYWFRTPPFDQSNWTPSLAIFGDMGNDNAQSLARLQEESQRHKYDAIIHVGDFAYDMDSEDAAIGDEYMRQIEPLAAYVPYMVCVGNHEEKYNFSNYKARFSMPGGTESLFYSFNMGRVHFVAFSTEFYYFLNYGLKQLATQYDWLINDLREANKPENRAQRPWIITYGHRPMYCSNDDDRSCKNETTWIRTGLPIGHLYGLEKLFLDSGVDVQLYAHQHSYERLWPIYNFEVNNGSYEKPYENAKAPVHIITGSAGCKEEHAKFVKDAPEWSAFRSTDYGYTTLKAVNSTHLYFEQISDDQDGQVIDSFWVSKDRYVPSYANLDALRDY